MALGGWRRRGSRERRRSATSQPSTGQCECRPGWVGDQCQHCGGRFRRWATLARGNCIPAIMLNFSSKEVRQLLHNKFVIILGDSIQRSVYKDLIHLLQNDSLLTASQMKAKGDLHFENDHLIEGGVLGGLHNGTHYREVRQYRTSHHLVRFYFLTRVYSPYLESILDDLQTGPQPDVLILNSCVWDISSRYGLSSMKEYHANLQVAFNRLDEVLPSCCLVIWNMTMPLGPKVTGGFLLPELQHLSKTLRNDVIEGNFYGATLAGFHLFDVVDLHYHFRLDLQNRVKDGVHWNNVVHRRITNLLLAHVADAWGVVIPDPQRWVGPVWVDRPTVPFDPPPLADPPKGFPDRRGGRRPDSPMFHEDSFLDLSNWESAEPFSGFTSFEDSRFPPFHPDGPVWEDRLTVPFDLPRVLPRPPLADPPKGFPDQRGGRRPDSPVFHEDSFLVLSNWESAEPISGFTSFEDSRFPPFHPDAAALNYFRHFERPDRSLFPPYPSHNEESLPPQPSCCHRKAHLVVEHHQGYVMRRQAFHTRDDTPYQRSRQCLYKQC